MDDSPRGTVTFLFTDIEGSTRLWRAYGEQMAAAYARHDAILRAAIAGANGVVYKTIGDAVQAAFPTATGGVMAALAAQRALGSETWDVPEPIRVRMALHSGAVDPNEDGDYRSPVLNRLGRLLDAGHGGQVLVSEATAGLVREGLPEGIGLLDLGPQRLKDLERAENICQLVAPSLEREFAPLRTLDARPNNLPAQGSRYVGRQDDLVAVCDLVRDPDVRLVTLSGPGGMGKTRLSLQAGAALLEDFEDGVFVVPLDALTDPELVPAAIAQVLGVREESGASLTVSLAQFLRPRTILLILDNLEQVVEAATTIGELIASCSRLTILATSRIRLQLRSEHEYPLRPLALPDGSDGDEVACESVQLFVDRARAARPAFSLTGENRATIGEICVQLDGMPLAIELAAARVRMLPPAAILKRLSSRLPLLTGGARDLPRRQQTLRDAIAWSYELLSPEDQALFRRLSIFSGGAFFDAIESVAPDLDVFAGLERLVDHNLVRQVAVDDEPRFSLFETIREFGMEELRQQGEADDALRHHAAFLTELADLPGSSVYRLPLDAFTVWIDRMGDEVDNLRAALEWSLTNDAVLAYRLATGAGRFWQSQGVMREGKAWVVRALSLDASGVPPLLRARLLRVGASFYDDLDDLKVGKMSEAWTQEAIVLFDELEDTAELGLSVSNLAAITMLRGDNERAMEIGRRSVDIARASGDDYTLAVALNNLGVIYLGADDAESARPLLIEAVAIGRDRDLTSLHFTLLNTMADVERAAGSLEEAERLYIESLELSRQSRYVVMMSANLMGLAMLAAGDGRFSRAARLAGADASLTRIRDVGMVGELFDMKDEYEQCLSASRDALGDEAFRRLWAEGAAMRMEEIIAALAFPEGLNESAETVSA